MVRQGKRKRNYIDKATCHEANPSWQQNKSQKIYYRLRWTVITNCKNFFITNCDSLFITNCDSTNTLSNIRSIWSSIVIMHLWSLVNKTTHKYYGACRSRLQFCVSRRALAVHSLNNSMRVNKIEAMYEVSQVNVKLCEVLIDAHIKITRQCKST